jgi:hypothetical protein
MLGGLFLLHTLTQFQIHTNPVRAAVTLLVFLALVCIMIYLNASKRVQNSKILKEGRIDVQDPLRHPASPEFFAVARQYGLSRAEAGFLEKTFGECGLKPIPSLRDKKNIDEHLEQVYRQIKRGALNEDDEMRKLPVFFTIHSAIDYHNSVLEIAQSKKNLTPRQHRRKRVSIPCVFTPLVVTEMRQGAKKVQKLTPLPNRLNATLLDVSAGGGAVQTDGQFKAGTRLKLEFKAGSRAVNALGIVLRVNKSRTSNVLHIKFIKVPPRSLQTLNAYVYDYRD